MPTQSPTTAHTSIVSLLSDWLLKLRQCAPITTTLKGSLPATLHESWGQRSPVASGLQDNSLAVPKTLHPHRLLHTQKQLLSPKLLCIKRDSEVLSFNPNIYSRADQTLFNTLLWKCRKTTRAAKVTGNKWQNNHSSINLLLLLLSNTHSGRSCKCQWKHIVRINPPLEDKTLWSSWGATLCYYSQACRKFWTCHHHGAFMLTQILAACAHRGADHDKDFKEIWYSPYSACRTSLGPDLVLWCSFLFSLLVI